MDAVCSESGGGCASPPYTISRRPPPRDETAHGFLSVVDLPVVPRITSPWIGTEPRPVSGNPSATACDQADFDGGGAGAVSSRSYVIPQTPELPTLFGLSETMGRFPNSLRAVRFLRDVTRAVGSCHKRQVTLSVLRSASFSSDRTSGRVWELRQKVSKTRALTFRVGLVRFGATVAEVTFTPADGYDVTPGSSSPWPAALPPASTTDPAAAHQRIAGRCHESRARAIRLPQFSVRAGGPGSGSPSPTGSCRP